MVVGWLVDFFFGLVFGFLLHSPSIVTPFLSFFFASSAFGGLYIYQVFFSTLAKQRHKNNQSTV
jgi:hypothetical protein